LSIAGDLDFSVFPWIAVEVSDLGLSNAGGFGEQAFAQIGEARVGVALMPLFRKQISVDEITLDGLDLALEIDAAGRSNWDDLATAEAAADAGESEPGMFSSNRVAGLNIRNANIEFKDRSSGAHYRLSGLSMQTGAVGGGDPVPLDMKTVIEDVTAGASAAVQLAAVAAIDLQAERYVLEDFELSVDLEAGGDQQALVIRAPRLDMDLAAQTLLMESYSAELANLAVNGSFNAKQILDAPVFTGSLSVDEFSPAALMQALQQEVPVTADPDVLKRATINAKLSGGSEHFVLDDVTMELDQSRFNGEFRVRDFDRPQIGFKLAVDEIDLDRYMEPAAGDTGPAGGEAADVSLPRDELRGQDVQGRLEAGVLRMAGLEFSDAAVGIVIRDGRLRINPLTAGFYGGRYSGDISLDASGDVPVVSLDEKIDSITFQRLVSDLVDSDALSGMALGHVRLAGRGRSGSEVLGSLQGDLGLTLTEGALEGINIWYEIRRGMALYKGMAPPEPEPARTVFSRMQLTADVKDGVMNTRQLTGELPFLTVRGDGAIDLGQSRVDLGLVAEVRDVPELADDPLGSELGGKSLPFKISGPLDAPSLSVDWEALLKSQATDMLLDKLGLGSGEETEGAASDGQEDESSEDSLEKAAKGALFDLLGGKDKDKDKDKDG
jgi:AsmA protein